MFLFSCHSFFLLQSLLSLLCFGFSFISRLTIFRYLVAGTTLWSGLSYVFSNNAVKILTKEEIQKRIAAAAAKKKN